MHFDSLTMLHNEINLGLYFIHLYMSRLIYKSQMTLTQ